MAIAAGDVSGLGRHLAGVEWVHGGTEPQLQLGGSSWALLASSTSSSAASLMMTISWLRAFLPCLMSRASLSLIQSICGDGISISLGRKSERRRAEGKGARVESRVQEQGWGKDGGTRKEEQSGRKKGWEEGKDGGRQEGRKKRGKGKEARKVYLSVGTFIPWVRMPIFARIARRKLQFRRNMCVFEARS